MTESDELGGETTLTPQPPLPPGERGNRGDASEAAASAPARPKRARRKKSDDLSLIPQPALSHGERGGRGNASEAAASEPARPKRVRRKKADDLPLTPQPPLPPGERGGRGGDATPSPPATVDTPHAAIPEPPPAPVSDAAAVALPEPPAAQADAPAVALLGARRRRRALLLIAGLCVCAAVLGGGILLFWKQQTPAQTQAALSGVLSIDVVGSARVGDAVAVTVGSAAAADGQPALLTMLGSYGPRIYRSTFAAGTARFRISSADTQQSGAATLIATAGAARGQAALTLAPDVPVDPITPLVGARSITADTRHWSMSVVVPFDRFGNPVADDTPVEVRALHPGDQLELQRTTIHNLVGWARIFSRTRAGRTTVSVTSAGAHGPDADFMEVPSWPIPFGISAGPANVPADGRQLITLRTDVIRDYYGNAMLDGTLVTFVVDTPGDQPRLIPAYTLDGIAKAQLQAPSEPGPLTVRAEIYAAESRPLQITFGAGPAVDTFPVAARIDAAGQAINLQAGPLLGALEQFIPDGTAVEFWLTDATGQRMRLAAASKGGYAQVTVRLAALPLGTYTAEARAGAGHGQVAFQVP